MGEPGGELPVAISLCAAQAMVQMGDMQDDAQLRCASGQDA